VHTGGSAEQCAHLHPKRLETLRSQTGVCMSILCICRYACVRVCRCVYECVCVNRCRIEDVLLGGRWRRRRYSVSYCVQGACLANVTTHTSNLGQCDNGHTQAYLANGQWPHTSILGQWTMANGFNTSMLGQCDNGHTQAYLANVTTHKVLAWPM
jgi:hypothetical protein